MKPAAGGRIVHATWETRKRKIIAIHEDSDR